MKKDTTEIKDYAPYVRIKDYDIIKMYDHDDVTTEFHSSTWLEWTANILASFGVFCLLILAIALLAEVPSSWIAWLVLAGWGV